MSSADNQSNEVTTYLEMLWLERGLSENTLAAYRRDLIDTQRVLAQAGVGSLEAADQADFARGAKPSTAAQTEPSQHRALAQHAERLLPLLGAAAAHRHRSNAADRASQTWPCFTRRVKYVAGGGATRCAERR